MVIHVNEHEYELNTKLRTIQKIENHFKIGVDDIFRKLGNAEIKELVEIINIAAGLEKGNQTLKNDLLDHWDYSDLMFAVQELIAQMLFSGTPEQQEAKISKFSQDETAKNAIREMLGLPLKTVTETAEPSTGSK